MRLLRFRDAPHAIPGLLRGFATEKAGSAAMEFAIFAPFLVALVSGIVDFGFAFRSYLVASAAVESGANYAMLNGQSLTSSGVSTFLTNVQTVVHSASQSAGTAATVAAANITVKFNNAADNSNFSTCYCLTGNGYPGTYSAAASCGANCADGTTAGKFVSISASYTYSPIFPTDNYLLGGAHSEAVTVRVQ